MNEADVGERTSFGLPHNSLDTVALTLTLTLARIDLYLHPAADRGCEG
jgi:hypothetical protein